MKNIDIEKKMRIKDPWDESAKRVLKAELVRKGVNHDRLSVLLAEVGVNISKSAIDSKLSRGTFSAAFLLQCLKAIGCNNLQLD